MITKIQFKTQSGSFYTIDEESKTWYRGHNPNSLFVRTEHANFLSHTQVEVGQSVEFICPPINVEATVRWICTSPVEWLLVTEND